MQTRKKSVGTFFHSDEQYCTATGEAPICYTLLTITYLPWVLNMFGEIKLLYICRICNLMSSRHPRPFQDISKYFDITVRHKHHLRKYPKMDIFRKWIKYFYLYINVSSSCLGKVMCSFYAFYWICFNEITSYIDMMWRLINIINIHKKYYTNVAAATHQ